MGTATSECSARAIHERPLSCHHCTCDVLRPCGRGCDCLHKGCLLHLGAICPVQSGSSFENPTSICCLSTMGRVPAQLVLHTHTYTYIYFPFTLHCEALMLQVVSHDPAFFQLPSVFHNYYIHSDGCESSRQLDVTMMIWYNLTAPNTAHTCYSQNSYILQPSYYSVPETTYFYMMPTAMQQPQ